MTPQMMANHPNRSKLDASGRNPTPAEIRAARDQAGLSQAGAADKILQVFDRAVDFGGAMNGHSMGESSNG